jgi:hypothetical protein
MAGTRRTGSRTSSPSFGALNAPLPPAPLLLTDSTLILHTPEQGIE